MSDKLPQTITIVRPMYIHRGRGRHSAGDTFGKDLRVRVTEEEYDLIKEVAEKTIDTSARPLSMFIRWCAVEVAKQLKPHLEKRDAHGNDDEVGKGD